MGVSQNKVCGTGSLSQGSVSRVCFVVCFGGLFRTVLLPRTVKFKGSVSGSVSKVCFGVCFGGLSRQSRTSQPYLKLHPPKKYKPICITQKTPTIFDMVWDLSPIQTHVLHFVEVFSISPAPAQPRSVKSPHATWSPCRRW